MLDGSQLDITSKSFATNYSSGDLSIASFGLEDGVIFGGQTGTTNITVSNNGKTTQLPVTVKSFQAQALSAISIPGHTSNVDVSGDYAYIASGYNGLTIVNVSDRTAPAIVSTLDTTGFSTDIKVVGKIVFIADGESGLQIIDVSDVENPRLIATHDTAGIAQDIQVGFQYVYIADGKEGLEVVNISDLEAPFTASTLGGIGEAKGIDLDGNTAILVAGRALHVINIAIPSAPVLQGSVNIGPVKDVIADKGFAYIAANTVGYRIVDYRNAILPSIVAGARDFVPNDVAVAEDLVFFSDILFVNGAPFVRTQEPENAVYSGFVDFTSLGDDNGRGIAVDSRYVYLITDKNRMLIGQYRQITDNKGVAPTITLNKPLSSDGMTEGTNLFIDVSAEDDVAVDYVIYYINGVEVARDSSKPYQFTYLIPLGTPNISVRARAVDLRGNSSVSEILDFTVRNDTDRDGLWDDEEIDTYNTFPDNPDSDADGLTDGREIQLGTNPLDDDSDDDGLLDGTEIENKTDPLNPDVTVPEVISVTPEDANANVREEIAIEVLFNEPLKALSIVTGVLELKETATNVIVTDAVLQLSEDKRSIIYQPKELLKDYTEYQITVRNVKDVAGNKLLADFISTFTVGNFEDFTAPEILDSNPTRGASDFPVTGVITITFDEPIVIDVPTGSQDIRLIDDLTRSYEGERPVGKGIEPISGSYTLSEDRRTLTYTSDTPLAVGRGYDLQFKGYIKGRFGQIIREEHYIKDLYGNEFNGSFYFTTSFLPDNKAPEVVSFSLADGLTEVPTNAVMQIAFDEPLNALKLTDIKLLKGTQDVVLQARKLSDDRRVVTLELAQLLKAQTAYTISVAGVEDASNNVLARAVETNFTTATDTDMERPSITSVTPVNNATVVLKPTLTALFSERLNPLTAIGAVGRYSLLENNGNNISLPIKLDMSLSENGRTMLFIPKETLKPDTKYTFQISSFTDLVGNRLTTQHYSNFYTTAANDAFSPEIISQSINNGLSGVPLNGKLVFNFDEHLDPECVNAETVRLLQTTTATPILGTVVLDNLGKSLMFSPTEVLSTETEYTLTLEGVCDLSGNVMSSTSTGYTTGSVAEDSTKPRVLSIVPENNAINISVNTAIVITFDEAIRPYDAKLKVTVRVNDTQLAGSYVMSADQTQLTFTPDTSLPTNTQIEVTINNDWYYDLAGNRGFSGSVVSFTTGSENADTKAPEVLFITPNNNAVDIDTETDVVITFSESLDSSTVNRNSFALFVNGDRKDIFVYRSLDNKTVTLSTNGSSFLAANSLISVVITDGVKDLSGNSLVGFISLFATGSRIDYNRPRIIAFTPGNGADDIASDKNITLYSDKALDDITLQQEGAFYVSQNGQLITGTRTLSNSGKVITFTPDQAFEAGSFIQVFANSQIQDNNGKSLYGSQALFRIKSDLPPPVAEPPRVIARSLPDNLPLNTVFGLRFSEVIDTSSVTTDSIKLYKDLDPKVILSSASLSENGKTLRVTPSQLLEANTSYFLVIKVADLDGELVTSEFKFSTGENATEDNLAPKVTLFIPESGRTGIGINTGIFLQFDEAINPLTLDSKNFISGKEGSLSIGSDNKSFKFTPHDPLPSSTLMTASVANVEDSSANILSHARTTFTTGQDFDLDAPVVVAYTPAENAVDFPTNGVISFKLNEAVDPTTLESFSFYDKTDFSSVETAISLSKDGRVVTFVPEVELAAGTEYSYSYYMSDLAGNRDYSNYSGSSFTTSLVADIEAPTVVGFSLRNGWTDIPTNALMQVGFNEPINTTKLAGIKLFKGSEELLLQARTLSENHRIVTLTLARLLDPQTTYTIKVADIEDTGGNVLTNVAETSFTTGLGADLIHPMKTGFSPASSSRVALNVKLYSQYSERLNPLTTILGGYSLKTYPGDQKIGIEANLLTDGLSISYNIAEALQPNTRYYLREADFTDLAGNRVGGMYGSSSHEIKTKDSSDNDVTAPKLVSQYVGDGVSGLPLTGEGIHQYNFDEELSFGCVNTSTVQMIETVTGSIISGKVNLLGYPYKQNSLVFNPLDALSPNTEYTITLDGVCDVYDNLLAVVSSSFTTGDVILDRTRPTITNISPDNNATGVSVDSSITITYSEAMSRAYVDVSVGGQTIEGSSELNSEQTQLTFTPNEALPTNAQVRLYMGYQFINDISGNKLNRNYFNYFTTSP